MKLFFEKKDMAAYLEHSDLINFSHPKAHEKIIEIQSKANNTIDQAKIAFDYVRDEISHSFDTQSKHISISASDAIESNEGICFAKSHLLAALLRGLGIPTGFCYQKTTRKGTVDSGYALHGLNAFYLKKYNKWFRVDPRGNKPGVNSAFNLTKEQLAYPIRVEIQEYDYPYVFAKPLESVLNAMKTSKDCHDLFFQRPETIQVDEKYFYLENELI